MAVNMLRRTVARATNPADRALLELLAVERGGVSPLRTASGDNGVFRRLYADNLIEPDPKSGRYLLTPAGRARAEAAHSRLQARGGGSS